MLITRLESKFDAAYYCPGTLFGITHIEKGMFLYPAFTGHQTSSRAVYVFLVLGRPLESGT